MYEAVLTINAGGSYESATEGTDTTIELWCNGHCDLLLVNGRECPTVTSEVRETAGIRDRVDRPDGQVIITESCLKERMEDNIEGYLERHGCLLVPPLKYRAGAKRIRVLGIDAASLSDLYRDLAAAFDVRVEAKTSSTSIRPDSPLAAVDVLVPALTDRQRDAFTAAYGAGYYEIPRRTTTEAIGRDLGVHRRTAEHHLRVAENKLLSSLAEYV